MKRTRTNTVTMKSRKRQNRANKPYVIRQKSQQIQAAQLVANARIGGLLGLELKYYDVESDGTTLTQATAGTPVICNPSTATWCLNSVAQGDGGSNRDGRKISMVKLSVRFKVNLAGIAKSAAVTALPAQIAGSFWVVMDTQNNGDSDGPDPADIWEYSAPETGVVDYFNNLAGSKRFRILKHQNFVLNYQSVQYDGTNYILGGQVKTYKCNVNLEGYETNYTATGPSIASIADNAIFVFGVVNDDTSAPASTVQLSYRSRLRYRG